jgi:predicted HAD superfamily Cof-like phosphohydrolase
VKSYVPLHVREFHEVYGQPIVGKPTVPSDDRVRLRLRLQAEEFVELLEACVDVERDDLKFQALTDALDVLIECSKIRVDLPEVADALCDSSWILHGSYLEFGIDHRSVESEVYRSNMSKLGADGKPVKRADGKITKGPNFSPPDIAGVLKRQGWEP